MKPSALLWGFASALVLICIGLTLQAQESPRWDLQDVSYLFPLPERLNDPDVLTVKSQDSLGPLLPRKHIEALPQLTPDLQHHLIYDQLRVVGVRIDPCFPEGDPARPKVCHPQIRMVWQPMEERRLGHGEYELHPSDAAIHTFYELSATRFESFARGLQELKKKHRVATQGLPLTVHAKLREQGNSGEFGREFRAWILRFAGEENLTRITFMTVIGGGTQWHFGGFDVRGGDLHGIDIPRIHTRTQSFSNMSFHKDRFMGGLHPEPNDPDHFNELMKHAESYLRNQPDSELRRAAQAIHRIENPSIHSPETMDCVSCHVAQPARLFLQAKRPDLQLDRHSMRFRSLLNLDAVGAKNGMTDRIRAFGYFDRDPAVSHRAIHESAAVAERMNRDFAR